MITDEPYLKVRKFEYYYYLRQQQSEMDFFREEPLDRLVTAYLELQQSGLTSKERKQEEVNLINSVIVACSGGKHGLAELMLHCQYTLEINSQDRVCLRRTATLLTQTLIRLPQLLPNTANHTLKELLSFACSKAFITECCNDFIELIAEAITRLQL